MTVFLHFLYICNRKLQTKKMKKFHTFLSKFTLLMVSLVIFCSCATKMSPIHQLQSLSEDMQKNGAYYTPQDWKDAALKFQDIRHDIGKYRYTPDERRQIGELEGQCAKYMVQGIKNGALNTVMGVAGEIKGILDGLGIQY